MNKFELINDDYSDIINLEHHVSSKHEKMSISNRAFQFAPFAALTGYSDAIDETVRTTDEMLIIDDNLKCIIDQKLNYIKLKNKALTLIKGIQELNLIKISEEPTSKLKSYLKKMRKNADTAPDVDEIAEIVEEVRAARYAKK